MTSIQRQGAPGSDRCATFWVIGETWPLRGRLRASRRLVEVPVCHKLCVSDARWQGQGQRPDVGRRAGQLAGIPKSSFALPGEHQVGESLPLRTSPGGGVDRLGEIQHRQQLSSSDGVHKLLRHLSEPVLPEVGNALRTYLRQLRRKRGETMTSFTVRHREEYEKACRALTRIVSGHAPDLGSRSSRTTSRRSSWIGIGLRRSQTPGPEQRPETGGNLDEEQARGSLDGSTTTDHVEDDPWTTWYREEERRAWAARGWVDYGDSYHEPRAINDEEEDSDYEEQLVEILPDVVKGWLLLEKAGLDSLGEESSSRTSSRSFHWPPLRAHCDHTGLTIRFGPEMGKESSRPPLRTATTWKRKTSWRLRRASRDGPMRKWPFSRPLETMNGLRGCKSKKEREPSRMLGLVRRK